MNVLQIGPGPRLKGLLAGVLGLTLWVLLGCGGDGQQGGRNGGHGFDQAAAGEVGFHNLGTPLFELRIRVVVRTDCIEGGIVPHGNLPCLCG